MSLKIFCFSIKKLKLLNKLPSYIVPFGLGDNDYPNNWLNEKTGENILHLNKFYGEATGMYWLWKNYLSNFKENDWIGFCQYRKFFVKNKIDLEDLKFEDLKNNIIKDDEKLDEKFDCILGTQFSVENFKFSKIIKNHFFQFLTNPSLLFLKKKEI